MIIAKEDFHSPFTGLIVKKGQAVLVPHKEQGGETFKKLVAEGKVVESDTAIGVYGSAETEGVHDRSQLTEKDLPGAEPQRVHDGSIEAALANRAAQAAAQAATARHGEAKPLAEFEPHKRAEPPKSTKR